jgi:DNA invertase Pin-like site-specific DNA recombinase
MTMAQVQVFGAPERIIPAKKCVIYTRVSTGHQVVSGLGMEAQLERCRVLARARGYEIVEEITDEAISGKDGIETRPGLARVVELAANREHMVVIVYSLSRLARRQSLVWALLDDRGDYRLQIVSASEPFDVTTPMGRAMLGILAVFAQLEADMCSERTIAALEARRARGLRLGPKPLSEIHPDIVLEVQRLYAAGMTCKALTDYANKYNLPTARGGRWSEPQMLATLKQQVKGGPPPPKMRSPNARIVPPYLPDPPKGMTVLPLERPDQGLAQLGLAPIEPPETAKAGDWEMPSHTVPPVVVAPPEPEPVWVGEAPQTRLRPPPIEVAGVIDDLPEVGVNVFGPRVYPPEPSVEDVVKMRAEGLGPNELIVYYGLSKTRARELNILAALSEKGVVSRDRKLDREGQSVTDNHIPQEGTRS